MKDNVNGRETRVALVVDNPYRDLPGLVLTARELSRRGVTSFLIPMNVQVAEIGAVAPDLVLMNYLRRNNEATVRAYQSAGIGTGILDTEGGVFSPVPRSAFAPDAGTAEAERDTPPTLRHYARTMAQDPDVRARVECYCAWTPEFAEYFGAEGRYDPRRVVVTGTPRSDFYAEPWRTAARNHAGYERVYGDRMVLVNGSFPLANPRFQTPEREVEQLIQEFSYDRDYAYGWQQTQTRAMLGLLDLTNRLAARFPDVAFVVRPHPFEGTERYQELLEARRNLRVVKEGTVEGWLLSACALLHWGSSTAIEGSLAGIPSFTPDWLPVHLPVPVVDGVTLRPRDEALLVDQLEAVLAGRFTLPSEVRRASAEAARCVFSHVDGRSHVRVADAVQQGIAARAARPDALACERLAASGWNGEWIASVQRWDHSEKRFTPEQVQTLLEAFQDVDAEGAPVQAEPLGRGREPFALAAGRSVVLPATPSVRAAPELSEHPHLRRALRALDESWRARRNDGSGLRAGSQ